MSDLGRPEYQNEQYQKWLEDMTPFLKLGNSLYFAMEKAMLLRHKDSIYGKYKLDDWFSEKIDAYQRYPGEIVNTIFNRTILAIDEKMKRGEHVAEDEWRNLRFFAEKHRSCQPFFVSRTETVQTTNKDIEIALGRLEESDYTQVAEEAKKQLEGLQQASAH